MQHPLPAATVALLALALAGCAEPRFPGGSSPRADTAEPGPASAGTPTDEATSDPATTSPGAPAVAPTRPADYTRALADARDALLADGAHALAEADVGYYMDVQEAALRRRLAGHAVRIARDGTRIRLTVSGATAFETGSRQLATAVEPILDTVAAVLAEYRATLVTIAAHSDPSGEAAFNRELSRARALVVARRLTDAGVDARRIVALGYGEARPVTSDISPGSRLPNRRIELLVEPLLATAAG